MRDTSSSHEKPEFDSATLEAQEAREALTEQQCRDALAFIEGYAPDVLVAALRQVCK